LPSFVVAVDTVAFAVVVSADVGFGAVLEAGAAVVLADVVGVAAGVLLEQAASVTAASAATVTNRSMEVRMDTPHSSDRARHPKTTHGADSEFTTSARGHGHAEEV
jgi:hypothetical protein